jgi:hypothetical protein
MKLNFELILELMKAENHPDYLKRSEVVMQMDGFSTSIRSESIKNAEDLDKSTSNCIFPILLMTPDELLGNGTFLGGANECFTQEVIDYMKKCRVTEIWTSAGKDFNNKYSIGGAVVDIPKAKAEKLSRLVGENGGSWRNDLAPRGWSSFECE